MYEVEMDDGNLGFSLKKAFTAPLKVAAKAVVKPTKGAVKGTTIISKAMKPVLKSAVNPVKLTKTTVSLIKPKKATNVTGTVAASGTKVTTFKDAAVKTTPFETGYRDENGKMITKGAYDSKIAAVAEANKEITIYSMYGDTATITKNMLSSNGTFTDDGGNIWYTKQPSSDSLLLYRDSTGKPINKIDYDRITKALAITEPTVVAQPQPQPVSQPVGPTSYSQPPVTNVPMSYSSNPYPETEYVSEPEYIDEGETAPSETDYYDADGKPITEEEYVALSQPEYSEEENYEMFGLGDVNTATPITAVSPTGAVAAIAAFAALLLVSKKVKGV